MMRSILVSLRLISWFKWYNLWLFFSFALNTLIELRILGGVYGAVFMMLLLISREVKSQYHRYILKVFVAPAVVNAFFVLNFIFSSSPQSQTYNYTYPYTSNRIFTSITLEGGQYDDFKGVRYFVNFKPFIRKSCVSYTVEEGLFGIKVVKDVLPTHRLPVE